MLEFTGIFDAIADGVLILDADHRIRAANPALAALLNRPANEVVDLPIEDIFADEELLKLVGLRSALVDDEVRELNVVLQGADEVPVPVTLSGGALRNTGGELQGLVLIVRDERAMQRLLTESARAVAAEKQRAEELQRARDALEAANEARDRMEIELRQAQKLEAVGQLAAGIAHEINTPVQFVSDSIYFLRDALTDLLGLVERYERLAAAIEAGEPTAQLLAEAREEAELADIEFVREEGPAACARTFDGLERVATIVRAMKDFAHPAADEKQAADINAAIRSTVTVATNEVKYVADVDLHLGDLPPVTCLLGDLNQVILNLVVNAAHAIADGGQDTRGTITVSTAVDGRDVVIRVADTGCGIPEDVRERIFDPFFTTKEVGRGSGQGLAIAHNVVVDKHSGTITADSEVGRGTTFTIRLPIDGGARALPDAA